MRLKAVNNYMLKEWEMMLMRTDPFRELDRLTQQVFGTAARRAAYDRSLAGRARPGDGPTEHPGPEDSHASRTIRQHHQDHAGALGKRAGGVSRRNVKEVRKP